MSRSVLLELVAASSVLLFWLPAATHAAPRDTVVETSNGAIEGVSENGIISFKGIAYAKPPVGDLRWREPQPVTKWSGTRKANHYGNACMQNPDQSAENGGDPGPLSEDCLYLNVWTPTLSSKAKLPVIVWIHGGGYVLGAGSLPVYDGTAMGRKGAVSVNLNYRLGPLGFFAHPALDKGASGGPYNFGLYDQVAALKWVKENIIKFGGDPDCVTIMGESAGGKSVLWHFASPLSRGLFQRGIAESVYMLPDVKLEKARTVAAKVASAVGLNGAEASLDDLRKVPPDRFFKITDKEANLGPVGIVGDAMLPRSIADTFESGAEARVPLIIGNTSDDASVVASFGLSPDEIMKKLGAAGFALKLLYPGVPADKLPRQALRDILFTLNTRWIADRRARHSPTWRFYFDYAAAKDRPNWPNGVPHGGEVVYFLDTLDKSYAKRDHAYARKVSGYVFAFADTGKPSFDGAAEWQDHKLLRDRTLVFGEDDIEQRRNFMKARLDVLKGVTKIADTLFGK
ncbi:MAG: carboxylesterase/lipase family protein [Hyphomicrobium sp.]|uniref:carboxylesterase/lipase family protein n=1 Tax=Hyphomicrobium sp. TaxID=82 RepID=UPI0039E3ACFF